MKVPDGWVKGSPLVVRVVGKKWALSEPMDYDFSKTILPNSHVAMKLFESKQEMLDFLSWWVDLWPQN